jgi:hypothetical protein
MSVNGLGRVSKAHMTSRGRKSAPLELQSDRIHNVYVEGDQQTDGTLVPTRQNGRPPLIKCLLPAQAPINAPQSRRGKAHRAPDVHRITKHVEREALNASIHQDPEIIAQERARDAERPRRGHDEGLSGDEERDGDERVERSREEARMRLF